MHVFIRTKFVVPKRPQRKRYRHKNIQISDNIGKQNVGKNALENNKNNDLSKLESESKKESKTREIIEKARKHVDKKDEKYNENRGRGGGETRKNS